MLHVVCEFEEELFCNITPTLHREASAWRVMVHGMYKPPSETDHCKLAKTAALDIHEHKGGEGLRTSKSLLQSQTSGGATIWKHQTMVCFGNGRCLRAAMSGASFLRECCTALGAQKSVGLLEHM